MVLKLYDEFLVPEIEPTESYSPGPDVTLFMMAVPPSVVLEIYRRTNNTIGARFSVWVGWRDAGGKVQRHAWTLMEPAPLVTDTIESAKAEILARASAAGLVANGKWKEAANQAL